MSRDEEESFTFEQRAIGSLPIGFAKRIERNLFKTAKLDLAPSYKYELVAHLTAYVLADHIGDQSITDTATFEYPATPWQHAKHDWRIFKTKLGQRFIKRYPVKALTHTVTLKVDRSSYTIYPEADDSLYDMLGKGMRHVVVQKNLSRDSWPIEPIEGKKR